MKIPFTSHIGTKAMALVLAIFLWGFAYLENLQTEVITYNVRINAPEGLQVNLVSRSIEIEVRGPRKKVEDLRSKAPIYIEKNITLADLESYAGLDKIDLPVSITAEDVNGESGLTFPELPKPLKVTLRRTDKKFMRVEIRVSGTPRQGYVYVPEDSYTLQQRVMVTGPKSLLDKTEAIQTEEFYINNLSQSFWEYQRLVTRIDGEEVQVSPPQVRVYVAIEAETATKTIENVPIDFSGPPDYPYKLTPDTRTVSVTVEGPAETVSILGIDDIIVFARIDDSMVPNETKYLQDIYVTVPEHPQLEATLSQERVSVKVDQP